MIFAQDAKIALLQKQEQNLNNQIANLTSQISSLKVQMTNSKTADLATALSEKEIISSDFTATESIPYNYLYISGLVNNTGYGTAYNTGLHVVAYDADSNSTLDINLTVPLADGASLGTNSEIDTYLTNFRGGVSSLQLGSLGSGEIATVNIAIYHEGVVSNWTVTPVWTNSP